MSFSFSFFSQRHQAAPRPEVVGEAVEKQDVPMNAPVNWGATEQPLIAAAPEEMPAAPTTGLAALAVQQCSGLLAPPPRRMPSYMTPGPAIAASLALAAHTPAPRSVPVEAPPAQTAPAANHFSAVQSLQSRDLAQMRVELDAELKQMRQDLFGAAMGVSTLKDRLDGLESSLDKKPSAPEPISAGDMEILVQNWLETHLNARVEQAVKASLDQAVQQTVSQLSSHTFFRLTAPLPGFDAETFLSQPPQILSATLT
ncbi:hypothetical protein [Prosthecobacter dejongeii]|uniref:Uncharacterized protein n=1 Tax=Prosthecobacter dejongeii TaxID=48465 RepID=A0A7W7YK36_9BACT|nr:hypothetical protein [Prosthecobacter dejongeii]MBB5037681.1 hypothetical protein [Prosthecobacter dejongeii]